VLSGFIAALSMINDDVDDNANTHTQTSLFFTFQFAHHFTAIPLQTNFLSSLNDSETKPRDKQNTR